MKINSSVRRWVFSREWVKLTQDELFSIFKSADILRMYGQIDLWHSERKLVVGRGPGVVLHNDRTSSRLHKTVNHYDYDYFWFMKEDYDYMFGFASGITITSWFRLKFLYLIMITFGLRLQVFCLITITKLLDYDYNLIVLNS